MIELDPSGRLDLPVLVWEVAIGATVLVFWESLSILLGSSTNALERSVHVDD